MDKTDLYRLTYASRSRLNCVPDQVQREIGSILAVSVRNNRPAGVTGALMFSADCFAQTLEGQLRDVQRVFERIQLDMRHSDTVVLAAGPIDRRDFADWSMAYAGRVEDERCQYDALTSLDDAASSAAGADHVLDLMRKVVLRAKVA